MLSVRSRWIVSLMLVALLPLLTGCGPKPLEADRTKGQQGKTSESTVLTNNGKPAMRQPNENADPNPTPKGSWQATSAVMAGSPFPEDLTASISLVISEETYKTDVGGQLDSGRCETDMTTVPHQMRLVGTEGPNTGKTILAIFDFPAEDQLRVSYDMTGTEFPTDYISTKENGLFVATYERKK